MTAIGVTPDGTNINVGCGATDLRALQQLVREERLDLGVAFDGDGDRMLAVDGHGDPLDGDQILAVLALDLKVDTVAVTTMTNLGFHRLMAERGIRVLTTDVGDRYVLEALKAEGAQLGGEQSGHIIFLDGHVTGDGLAGALLLCGALQGRTLAEAASVLERYPQAKRNVRVARREVGDARATRGRQAERGARRRGPHSGAALGHRAPDPRAGRGGNDGKSRRPLCYRCGARRERARLDRPDAGAARWPGFSHSRRC